MEDNIDDLTIEELLKDVDVLGKPGIYWTAIGTAIVLSLCAATGIWRLSCWMRGVKA